MGRTLGAITRLYETVYHAGIDDNYIEDNSESSPPLDNTNHTDITPYSVQRDVQNELILNM